MNNGGKWVTAGLARASPVPQQKGGNKGEQQGFGLH